MYRGPSILGHALDKQSHSLAKAMFQNFRRIKSGRRELGNAGGRRATRLNGSSGLLYRREVSPAHCIAGKCTKRRIIEARILVRYSAFYYSMERIHVQ